MLKHIVMFKLNSLLNKSETEKAKKEIIEALSKLPDKIKEIKSYSIKENELYRNGAADIILISEFENEEDLNSYRKNEEHMVLV